MESIGKPRKTLGIRKEKCDKTSVLESETSLLKSASLTSTVTTSTMASVVKSPIAPRREIKHQVQTEIRARKRALNDAKFAIFKTLKSGVQTSNQTIDTSVDDSADNYEIEDDDDDKDEPIAEVPALRTVRPSVKVVKKRTTPPSRRQPKNISDQLYKKCGISMIQLKLPIRIVSRSSDGPTIAAKLTTLPIPMITPSKVHSIMESAGVVQITTPTTTYIEPVDEEEDDDDDESFLIPEEYFVNWAFTAEDKSFQKVLFFKSEHYSSRLNLLSKNDAKSVGELVRRMDEIVKVGMTKPVALTLTSNDINVSINALLRDRRAFFDELFSKFDELYANSLFNVTS